MISRQMTVAHAPLQESDMLWKSGGQALVNREKEAHDRAEAIFKKTEDRRLKIAAQYEAEANAVRANTARLRALRLASEAVKADRLGPAGSSGSDRSHP